MKKVLITILIIIIVVILGVGGYFAYQKYFTPKTQNPTVNWETFKNSDYGIEFKYPKGLFDNIDPQIISSCATLDQEKPRAQLFFGNYDSGLDSNTMSVYIPCSIVDKNTLAQDPKNGEITDTKIGGRDAFMYSYTNDNTVQGLGGGSISKNFVVPFDGYSLRIDFFSGYDVSSKPKIVEGETINQILSTFKFTNLSVNQTTDLPIINSISPSSGPKGTVIEIQGKNLSGLEGDLNVSFERADGKIIILTDNFGDYPKTGGNIIKVKVVEPCQKGETVTGEYSGIKSVCDYVELTPGAYKVYTAPWGLKSNAVNFEITK